MIRPIRFVLFVGGLIAALPSAHAQTGACCLDGGSCFTGTAENCGMAVPPGAYQGDGSSCLTALCGQQGACCFADGSCELRYFGPCDASPGTFQGDGTTCSPNACPPPAPVPTQINHQGVVSVNGQRFTGNGNFYFAIIDPVTGNSVWTNDATNIGTGNRPNRAVVIPCVNGLYSVRLGDLTLPNMKLVPVNVFSSENRSLRIWFDDRANGIHQLTPDHVLTTVPYSFRAAEASGGIPRTIVFTSNGTWTKPSGLKYIEVEVVGGGGGGGGTNAGSSFKTSGGGGAGAYCKKVIAATGLGSTESVIVGSGGAGATGTGTVTPGGDSEFGAHMFAGGGSGGFGDNGAPSLSPIPGGAGGTAVGGDINVNGQNGEHSTWINTAPSIGISGEGGDSAHGHGGRRVIDDVDQNGVAGVGYGGGGSGCVSTSNGCIGGGGSAGVVIIKEFF